MADHNRRINYSESIAAAEGGDNLTFHPNRIYLTLLLFSLSILFLALTGAYLYNRFQAGLPPLRLPVIFLFNTFVLLGGSWAMSRAKTAYRDDDTVGYQRMLLATLIASLLFMALQCVGWYQLFSQDRFINSDNSAGYLYVISALHFAHVIAGLPFLIGFLIVAYRRMKEPVSVLVYFSDPQKRLKLQLLTLYWHFLDGLWIYLVLFFFANQLLFG